MSLNEESPAPATGEAPARSRLDKFEALSKSVLNLVLIFGAVGGGLWAFSQFFLTEQVRRSALELDQLERAQREESRFESTLVVRQARHRAGNGCAITGTVGLRNRTAEEIQIDYSEFNPLMVGRAVVASGTFTFQDVALHPLALPHHPTLPSGPNDTSVVEVGVVKLPPGRLLEIPFLVPVPGPGPYVVLLRPGSSDRRQPEGGSARLPSLVWLGAALVEVEAGEGCG